MNHSDDSIRQLTETVNTLAVVVAKNESRYLSIEKTFRWAAVAFLCLTLVVFYMGFNMISNVEARAISRSDILEEVVKFFEDLEKMGEDTPKFIHDVKTVVENTALLTERLKQDSDQLREQAQAKTGPLASLQEALVLIHRIKEDSDMLRGELPIEKGKGTGLINHLKGLVDSINGLANIELPNGTDKSTVRDVMFDSLVLIHRLRKDSDLIREKFKNRPQALSISQELRNLNIALSSVPLMVEEMRRMNASIGVMSYGMDSTMGRMGRMMPGGWW
jgi:hypothetical protein